MKRPWKVPRYSSVVLSGKLKHFVEVKMHGCWLETLMEMREQMFYAKPPISFVIQRLTKT